MQDGLFLDPFVISEARRGLNIPKRGFTLWITTIYRVFQKFVDILKSLYFIQICYISLHFLTDINESYYLSIFYESHKILVEINILPPKGANLYHVCFCTFPPFLSVFSSN